MVFKRLTPTGYAANILLVLLSLGNIQVLCQVEGPNLVAIRGRSLRHYERKESTATSYFECLEKMKDDELSVVSFDPETQQCILMSLSATVVLWDRKMRNTFYETLYYASKWVTAMYAPKHDLPVPILLYLFDNVSLGTNLGDGGPTANMHRLSVFDWEDSVPNGRNYNLKYMRACHNMYPVPLQFNGFDRIDFRNHPYTMTMWWKMFSVSSAITVIEGMHHGYPKIVYHHHSTKGDYFSVCFDSTACHKSTRIRKHVGKSWRHFSFVFTRPKAPIVFYLDAVVWPNERNMDLRGFPSPQTGGFLFLPHKSPTREVALACAAVFQYAFTKEDIVPLMKMCP